MKLHTGDNIVVIAGKDKGKTGRILRVLIEKARIVVTGINMRTRHMKKTQQSPGRKIRYEASLDVSNVMLIDPKTKKRTRIGVRYEGGKPHSAPDGATRGKKERFAKKSGEALLSGQKLKKLVEEEKKIGDKDKGKGVGQEKKEKKSVDSPGP